MTKLSLCLTALLALALPAHAGSMQVDLAAGEPATVRPAAVDRGGVGDLTAILVWRDGISPELRQELATRCAAIAAAGQLVPGDAVAFCHAFGESLALPLQ